jgi:trigger factor
MVTRLNYEASEKVANTKFWEIVKEKDLNPIDTPVITDIKFEPQSDLYFKIKFEILPQIEIKDYKGLEIEVPKVEIRDEDVEYEIKSIQQSNREMQDVEEVGDNRDYVLTVNIVRVDENGNVIEGTSSEKIQIDLSNERVQPEILENAKGKKVGESFSFSFNDERMVKNLKGEEEKVSEVINYQAEIVDIKKAILPELNEEFIKKITRDRVSSEEELRKNITEDLKKYLDNQVEEILRSRLIEKILQNNPFEPPHSMVHRYLDEMIKIEEQRAKQQGKTVNKQDLSRQLHTLAETELKWHMLKENLKEKENISVTDDEMQELAQKEADKTGITVDKLINYYNSSGYKNKLSDQKVFDFLKNSNTLKFVEPKEKGQGVNE